MTEEKNYTLSARCGVCGRKYTPKHAGDDICPKCGGQALYVQITPKEKNEPAPDN